MIEYDLWNSIHQTHSHVVCIHPSASFELDLHGQKRSLGKLPMYVMIYQRFELDKSVWQHKQALFVLLLCVDNAWNLIQLLLNTVIMFAKFGHFYAILSYKLIQLFRREPSMVHINIGFVSTCWWWVLATKGNELGKKPNSSLLDL